MAVTIKLIHKDFKSSIMNIIKDLKKTYTLRKEMDAIKKSQVKILELKIKISETKILLDGPNTSGTAEKKNVNLKTVQ